VKRLAKPLVLDADGLNAFEGRPEELRASVITPHPGEAARLLGISSAEIQADRLGAAKRLVEVTGAVVLLKGAGTVIAGPEGPPLINPTGGPALAAGGSGDVLTGVVAAFLAQGLPAREAAGLGAFVHGLAADRATAGITGGAAVGRAGLLAGELADALPEALAALACWPALEPSLAAVFP
jgi:NAD(P)H-hydrate epimerase